ncbi:hypothetical protein [Paludisphaera sp.]|uniref:hypothetical protein n=1 Tax=Paludisphaera sp. TaxID=2017432 RepID=UPI00301DD67D
MTRGRLGLIAGGIAVAFALAAIPAMAQDQNRGGRRGGPPGGFGGPGGPGGFGRGGPGGGGLIDLAGREPIQEELKITEEQKAKIAKLAEEARARREKVLQPMREQLRNQMRQQEGRGGQQQPRGNQNRRGGNQGSNLPSAGPAATGVILRASYQPQDGGYGGFGVNPYVQEQPVDPAMQQRMMQEQQRMMQNQQRMMQRMQGMQAFQQVRQAEQKLRKDEEAALAKILDAKQMKRLREISVQLEGPFAILSNEELAQKLSVNEEQFGRIREIQQKSMQSGRNAFQPMRELMEKFRATQPQAQNQEGNAQNRGRGGFGNFDREAFQKFMDQPDSRAALEKMRDDQLARRDAEFSAVLKVLDRGQASKYRNMLGDKYDTTALMRGMFGGPRGPGGPGGPPAGQPPAAGAAATAATPAPAETAAEAAPKAEAAKAETPKAAAPAGRGGSLRERRGVGPRS